MLFLAVCAASAASRGHAAMHVLHPQDELLASRQELADVRAELAAARAELRSVKDSIVLAATEHKSQIAMKGPQKVFDDALGKFHLFPALAGTFRLGVFEQLEKGNQTFDQMRNALNVSAKGIDALFDFLVTSGLVNYDKDTGTFANHPDLAKMNLTDFKTQVMGFAVSTQASGHIFLAATVAPDANALASPPFPFPLHLRSVLTARSASSTTLPRACARAARPG